MNARNRPFPALVVAITIVMAAGTAGATGNPSPAPAAHPAQPVASHPTTAPAPVDNVVYKWKDARGVSQYSQQPPPKGVKFEMVPMTGSQSPAAAPVSSGGGSF